MYAILLKITLKLIFKQLPMLEGGKGWKRQGWKLNLSKVFCFLKYLRGTLEPYKCFTEL